MELRITRCTLLVLALSGLVGCSSARKPTIAIDGWWDVDYAKQACESAKAASEQRFEGIAPCVNDPSDISHGVERDFLTAFQENPACAGVSIVNDFHDPDEDAATSKVASAAWGLSFNIAIRSGELSPADSQWQIIDRTTLHRYADGDLRNFSQAATKVCTVVKGKGGELQ
jgi:hypothetical protein